MIVSLQISFDALSSSGFSIFYLVLLVISLIISWRVSRYGIIAVAFLVGLLSPMIIAAILYLVLIIIGIVIVLIFEVKVVLRNLHPPN